MLTVTLVVGNNDEQNGEAGVLGSYAQEGEGGVGILIAVLMLEERLLASVADGVFGDLAEFLDARFTARLAGTCCSTNTNEDGVGNRALHCRGAVASVADEFGSGFVWVLEFLALDFLSRRVARSQSSCCTYPAHITPSFRHALHRGLRLSQ